MKPSTSSRKAQSKFKNRLKNAPRKKVASKKPTPFRNKIAQFDSQSKNALGQRKFDRVKSVGWVNDPLILGRLVNVRKGVGRTVFEFKFDNGKMIDAWSSKTSGWAGKNERLLKVGYKYVIKGKMYAQYLSKNKYDRGSNSTFKFKLHLLEISVVEEEIDNNVQAVSAENEFFEHLNQLIKSGKSFTEKVNKVTILSGEVRRYIGCSTCYSGTSKSTKKGQLYCKRCKCEPTKRICLIIRNLILRDTSNEILENAICFQEQCNQLFGKENVEKICHASSTDLRAREELEFLKGTIISATIQHQKPTGSQQKPFNVSKLIVTDLSVDKYSRTPQIVSVSSMHHDSMGAQCLCGDDDDDDDNDDEFGDGDEDDALGSDDQPFTISLDSRRELSSSDPQGHYQLEPSKEGWTGMCILINMTKDRKGSENDVERLKKLFPELGVRIFSGNEIQDLNKNEFYAKVEEFKLQLINEGFSSLFFVLMSHGSLYNLRLHDYTRLNVYKDILPLFGQRQFPEFSGKPKIFLFQACQNLCIFEDLEAAQDFCNQFIVDDTDSIYDTLECYPCSPGVKAVRSKTKGSYFIQTLVDVFQKYWKAMDIEIMLKKVQERMINRRLGKEGRIVNTPVYKPIVFSRKFRFLERQSTQERGMTNQIEHMEVTD